MPGCYRGHKDIDAMYYIAVLVLVYHYRDLIYGLDPDLLSIVRYLPQNVMNIPCTAPLDSEKANS